MFQIHFRSPRPKVLLSLVFIAIPSGMLAAAAAENEAAVRRTIQRGLPFLAEHGESWMAEKKCASCHRVAMMTWAFQEAKQHGFVIDDDKLGQWTRWNLETSLTKDEKDGVIRGSRNLDGLAQMILGRGSERSDADMEASYAALTQLIVDGQQDDGSWQPAGQLPFQKRPKTETTQVSTMWIALSLASVDEQDAAVRSTRERAGQWLREAKSGKSTEWFVARLLLESRGGEDSRITDWQNQLRRQQNDDGGFPWLVGGASDAMATGQALYALAATGTQPGDPAIERASTFLRDTQRNNGSWAVHGTKAKKKDHIEETASYWGTAWAVIGLLETLR